MGVAVRFAILTVAVLLGTAICAPFAIASQEEEAETKVVANDSDSVTLEDIIPGGDPSGEIIVEYQGSSYYNENQLSGGAESTEEGEEIVTVGSTSPGADDASELYGSLNSSGALGSDYGLSSGSGFSIDGDVTRAELRRLGITKLTLRGLDTTSSSKGKNSRALTYEELGIVAASKTLEDSNIESAYIALERIEISYRSLGRLFGFIPFPFTLKITIVPDASLQSERVKLGFPWYRFFLRTYVSEADLQNGVDAAIGQVRAIASAKEYESDTQALLFIAVSDILKERSDAIAGSVGETN